MEEQWREIDGTNGLYLVSNTGRVKRKNRVAPDRILKQVETWDGYYRVSISDGHGNIRTPFVHRLVAMAFIENPDNFPVINHKDEDKKNNHVDNLEWCTVKYNTNYNNASFRRMEWKRKKVAQVDCDGNTIKVWDSATSAAKTLNIHRPNIVECCLKNRRSAGGFRWSYV